MSSILFAIEVMAFAVIAIWACRNDRIAPDESGFGLLAFRSATGQTKRSRPRWCSDFRGKAPNVQAKVNQRQPRWKSQPAPRR